MSNTRQGKATVLCSFTYAKPWLDKSSVKSLVELYATGRIKSEFRWCDRSKSFRNR